MYLLIMLCHVNPVLTISPTFYFFSEIFLKITKNSFKKLLIYIGYVLSNIHVKKNVPCGVHVAKRRRK